MIAKNEVGDLADGEVSTGKNGFRILRDQLLGTRSPETLFGDLKGTGSAKLAALNTKYFELVKRCRQWTAAPKDEQFDGVEKAFVALSDLYRLAQEKIRNGKYGEGIKVAGVETGEVLAVIEGEKHTYCLRELLAEGDVASIYRADYVDEQGSAKRVCLKIAREIADNELLENEQKILGKLAHVSLPTVVEVFELGDGRAISVLNYVEGSTFHQIRNMAKHENGLDDPNYHLGWILERQLAVLGYLHSQGVVHGSVEPAHLIVQPGMHNVVLIDFCWATKKPTEKDHVKIAQEYYSPPEVYKKAAPHPAMDIYGLGKSAIYLLGGNPEFGVVPDTVDQMYKNFLERMTEESSEHRAADAFQLAHHLVIIRDEVSGKDRDFVVLPVDAPTTDVKS